MAKQWVSLDTGGTFLKCSSEKSKGLLIFFAGFRGDRTQRMQKLAEQFHDDLPHVDMFFAKLTSGSWFTSVAPEVVALGALQSIDAVCKETKYDDVRVFAYSMGAAFARKVLIGAFGQKSDDVPFEGRFTPLPDPSRQWHRSVSRIVFLAGLTRGWIVSDRQSLPERVALNLFGLFGHVSNIFRRKRGTWGFTPTIFTLRRGAPFIINTRLQWLCLMRSKGAGRFAPTVVHLLPSQDNLVSPVEIIDIELMKGSRCVHYLNVANSNHGTVMDVSPLPKHGIGKYIRNAFNVRDDRHKRCECVRAALLGSDDKKRKRDPFNLRGVQSLNSPGLTMPMSYLDDNVILRTRPNVSLLTFVIHGIRDNGFWTKKIGAEIRRAFDKTLPANGKKSEIATDTQSYGYFAALPFVFPWIRQVKVEWLMDRYANARAIYPNAEFSYFGHSNGTYLAANALERYDTCRFKRIAFAGSVVRRDFEWKKYISTGRVKAVLNYVATGDNVVALFPKGLRFLRFDLGSAGHDGFDDDKAAQNVKYVVGGHGAGVGEPVWEEIANFIVNGKPPPAKRKPDDFFADKQKWLVKALGNVSIALIILGFIVIAAFGWSLLVPLLKITGPEYVFSKLAAWTGVTGSFNAVAGWLNMFWNTYERWDSVVQAICVFFYIWLLRFLSFRF